ncbi:ArsR family transcriptional regulator [Candidatus Acidianus copahuensis]|uniref:ArsR family transcriptional regulator n=2 Tax=Sulfolobaceae TaxID=118883 RepID=A0A031LKJ9_9CREN|nr:ArsR family transcriptional regulator [Candidatus Acidianus copahuensis]NON63281.1 winged helix-turn-helix transcriptional regulator [Acidianus sp. RZ1]
MEGIYTNEVRRKIYFYLLKQKDPVGIKKIQRDLKVSSASLVYYHLKKLEEQGLVREKADGYVVEKVILSDYVKIANIIVPRSAFFASFLISSIGIMLFFIVKGLYPQASLLGVIELIFVAWLFVSDLIKKYKEIQG